MKTAWIFPGGAARAVYSAGIIYALCEMNLKKPDIIIGCSGNAPTSLCYVSGQKEIIKNVWCRCLSTYKFLTFWRIWKVVNVDYLIDEVLKKQNPLDIALIQSSPIDVYFPLTDSKTGGVEYFSTRTPLDLWEVMRATVSVPLATNLFSFSGVFLKDKFYSDSIATSRFQVHVKKAIQEGAERIIIFDNLPHGDKPPTYIFSSLFTLVRNKTFRRRQFAYLKEIKNFTPPEAVEFFLISPENKLGMSHWNTNNQNANNVFNRGYNDTISNKKLLELYK
jgi:predicted patatin/cPLA2 family phospholipase